MWSGEGRHSTSPPSVLRGKGRWTCLSPGFGPSLLPPRALPVAVFPFHDLLRFVCPVVQLVHRLLNLLVGVTDLALQRFLLVRRVGVELQPFSLLAVLRALHDLLAAVGAYARLGGFGLQLRGEA